MSKCGQICSDMVGCGQIWLDMVRYGQRWPNIARYFQICLDVPRYENIDVFVQQLYILYTCVSMSGFPVLVREVTFSNFLEAFQQQSSSINIFSSGTPRAITCPSAWGMAADILHIFMYVSIHPSMHPSIHPSIHLLTRYSSCGDAQNGQSPCWQSNILSLPSKQNIALAQKR